jgi:zinc transport system substrate-binding protein
MKPGRISVRLLAALSLTISAIQTASAETPSVVVSIAPLHSVTASVMQGRGEPQMLVPPGASPHSFSLRPSDARALNRADLVVMTGLYLERFLERPLENLAGKAVVIEALEVPGMKLIEAGHDDHDHHDGHDDHEEHADHKDHDDHDGHKDHGDHDAKEEGHDEAGHEHDHGPVDPHFWLDPQNAAVLAVRVAAALGELDPEGAEQYRRNAEEFGARMNALTEEVTAQLEPVKGMAFVTFHDAYRYFTERFELNSSGVVTVSPETAPGAAHIAEMADRMKKAGVVCLFSEPQFEPRLVKRIASDTGVRTAELDPLGTGIDEGAGQYEGLVRKLAASIASCLGEAGGK